MNKYVSITIDYTNNTPLACFKCWGVIDPKTCNVVYSKVKRLDYTQAMRELRRFERRLHEVAELKVNYLVPHISSKTLWGWVSEDA